MQATVPLSRQAHTAFSSVVGEDTDADLAAQIRSGSRAALAEAYERHGRAVFAAAYAVTRRRDLAEETTQDVFVRLWRRAERFDAARGSLRSFLKIDARGRAIDAVRSEQARRDREDKEARLDASTEPRSVEEEVMNDVTSARVRELLSGLRPEERAPITLAYFDGHSYREVALMLGLPEGTVKSRIRTGLARLKDLLVAAGIE